MTQIDLIAIIYPKEGKADRVAELLNEISQYIKANEPGTLKYEVNKEVNKKSGAEEIILVESYKDKAAITAHGASEAFKAFGKKLKDEDVIAKPMQLKFLKNVGGFSSRL
ncbi:ded0aac4-fbad-4099-a19a-16c0bfbaea6a [Sclerotinia trifoliorum]|uniref:Ded0aac4-fbad-4099-a19a-16c0bfbaea6a n=1 Tax=Sclerotinia trifoliorum TaxID=28548 RepID=A0A8H2ZL19_9HELO|nr:ded0aac4-fbad-4099-a19a-16c0bfbaea6a [Sclerotinia trifoliorum]